MTVRKLLNGIVFTAALAAMMLCIKPQAVYADSLLSSDTQVYYANSKIYHLKGECGTLSTSTSMELSEALDKGMQMCEKCAKEAGLDLEKAKELSKKDLPIKIKSNVSTASSNSASDKDKDNDADTKSTGSNDGSGSSKVVSSSASSSSSSSSSSGKSLMSQSQRKKKFYSKTNPKRGEKPVTTPKPASAGFMYGDFATFNSYASENGLGYTPIYIAGTIKAIEKVENKGAQYGAVMMVDDIDGYQWYLRLNVSKDKYDLMRGRFLGKTANVYGLYTGYSGVTGRPMMDPTVIIEAGGTPVDLTIYQ